MTIIRRMIRLWWLCFYFELFHSQRLGTLEYYDNKVDEHEFINYVLNEKHFGEDVRETLKRWIHGLFGVWILQGSKGMNRMQKQRKLIFDLIEDAKKREYLLPVDSGLTGVRYTKLNMDYRGRNFIRTLPFLNAVLKEYGYFTSFFFGAGGATVLWLIKYFLG